MSDKTKKSQDLLEDFEYISCRDCSNASGLTIIGVHKRKALLIRCGVCGALTIINLKLEKDIKLRKFSPNYLG